MIACTFNKRSLHEMLLGCIVISMLFLSELNAYCQTRVADISRDKRNQTITIVGKIDSIDESSSTISPYLFNISDESGEIKLVIWPEIYDKLVNVSSLKERATIKATGVVLEYRGEIHLHLADPNAIEVIRSPEAPLVSCGAITRDMMGKLVRLRGKVLTFRSSWKETAPNIVTISDGKGSVDVVYWENVAKKLPQRLQNPEQGMLLEVEGDVDEYRRSLQIRVANASDIREVQSTVPKSGVAKREEKPRPIVSTPATLASSRVAEPLMADVTPRSLEVARVNPRPPSAPALNPFAVSKKQPAAIATPVSLTPTVTPAPAQDVNTISISAITKQMSGTKVTVAGNVKNLIRIDGDDVLMVEDGTGTVYVPIWERLKNQLPSAKQPQIGAKICISGHVHFPHGYEETLIVIKSPDDVISCIKE